MPICLLSSIGDVYGLQQLIIDPTRCIESSSTLIDLIFTNSLERVVCSGVSHISISDHFLVYANPMTNPPWTDNWTYNIDQGNVNAVVFLDLKKAFDTVDHDIPLSKLKEYGVSGTACNWFQSYLDFRNQRCFVNGSLSDYRPLTFGIPQGTI